MNKELRIMVATFREQFGLGVEHILAACQTYVTAIDQYDEAKREFERACPDIPKGAWTAFEAVGRGVMDARLLWGGGKAKQYVRRLPVSDQREVLNRGVAVYAPDGTHRMVPVTALNTSQVKRVFAYDHVRTPTEQKVIMDEEAMARKATKPTQPKTKTITAALPYELFGDKLHVFEPCVIPVSDLRRLLPKE